MAITNPTVDIFQMPMPDVFESLDYEAILAALKNDLIARAPDTAPVLSLESEPMVKLLEVAAYRELLLRARVNDAARAVMLPWAIGSDLDNIAARYDIARLPGEDDARLRARVLIGYHALSAAGSAQSWTLRAMSVSVDVRQVDVWADRPGRVKIALLARVLAPQTQVTEEDQAIGMALFGLPANAQSTPPMRWRVANTADPIISQVSSALLADDVRPLTVDVDVTSARIKPVTVRATLIHASAEKTAERIQLATQQLKALANNTQFRVDLTRSQIIAALMVDGVRDIQLTEPPADIPADEGDLPVISHIEIKAEVRHD